MSSTHRSLRLLGGGVLAFALLGLSACSDNPSCVFTTGCGSSTGPGTDPATLPELGMTIRDERPTFERAFPSGTDVQGTTPIGVVFSESMSAASLRNAIEVVQSGGPFGGSTVAIGSTALVGDGHLFLLFPQLPFTGGDVEVRLADGALITDITGQRLNTQAGAIFTTFTVDPMGDDEPKVVGTWPNEGDVDRSDIGEIIVAFDRPLLQSSVTDSSFIVKVDTADPSPDPVPEPISIGGSFGGLGSETRVFRYRNEDVDDVPVPLAAGGLVEITMSPTPMTAEITDPMGNGMMRDTLSFRINDIGTATDSRLASNPSDAVGIANLTAGDPEELRIEVDVPDGKVGDWVDLFLFGDNTDPVTPQLIALRRSVQLTGTEPITSAVFDLAAANIAPAGPVIRPRFADGRLAMAFRLRRAAVVTPLQVMDVDPATSGLQDALLDVTPPVLEELLHESTLAGVSETFRTDQRDAVFIGRADEVLRSVETTLTLGGMTMSSNGTAPPVVGDGTTSDFISAPAPVDPGGMSGILAGGTASYSLVTYDRALNPSTAAAGSIRQVGVVGTTALSAGDLVEVEVYDALTLAPLPAATVYTHADAGDGINFPFLSQAAANSDGIASGLSSHMIGQAGTIVTVDLTGYDLFTYHGIPTTRISVPLMPTGLGASALLAGAVRSNSFLSTLALPLATVYLSDARSDLVADTFFASQMCGPDLFNGGTSCVFGPRPILPETIGSLSLLAGNFIQTDGLFTPRSLVQAFDLRIPLPSTEDAASDQVEISLPYLLDPLDGAPLAELAVELPLASLDTQGLGLSGIDLGNLDGDANTTGDPRVRMEALVPGIARPVPVGMGLAFDQGGGQWKLRSVVPGDVLVGGFFEANGTIDPDLYLRTELRDNSNARTVRRERLSAFPGLPTVLGNPALVAESAATLISPAPGGMVTGPSYEVTFDDVLPDGFAGLYRVELDTGSSGRKWQLWRTNADGGANVVLHLPDIESQGGVALPAGSLSCEIEAWSWNGFDATAFLWSDLPRFHEVYSRSLRFSFSQL